MPKLSPQQPGGFIRVTINRMRFLFERLMLRGLGFRLAIPAGCVRPL